MTTTTVPRITTDTEASTLHEYVCALAEVCDMAESLDGQGFSKNDVVGHHLALLRPEEWGEAEVAFGRYVAAKYRRQLVGFGFNPETHEEEETSWSSNSQNQVLFDGDRQHVGAGKAFLWVVDKDRREVGWSSRQPLDVHGARRDRSNGYYVAKITEISQAETILAFASQDYCTVTDDAEVFLRFLLESGELFDDRAERVGRIVDVDVDGSGYICVVERHDTEGQQIARNLPTRTFDWTRKCWVIPYRASDALEGLVQNGFSLTAAAQERLSTFSPEAAWRREIQWDGVSFVFVFDRDDRDMRDTVKGLPSRKFVGTHWEAPHDMGAEIAKMSSAIGIEITPDVQQAIETAPNPYRILVESPDSYAVYFPYHSTAKDEIKLINAKYSDKGQPHWRVKQGVRHELQAWVSKWETELGIKFAVPDEFKITRTISLATLSGASDIPDDAKELGEELLATLPDGLAGVLRESPYQLAGVIYMHLTEGQCINADVMGLGKSLQALAYIESAQAYPALIVCPAQLRMNWVNEVKKWLPHRTAVVITRDTTEKAIASADIHICSYAFFEKGSALAPAPKVLLADESHALKNHKAARTQAVNNFAQGVPHRILLSGTPAKRYPGELVSQLAIIGKVDNFGGVYGFIDRYCVRGGYGVDPTKGKNVAELTQKLRDTCYIRRGKSVLGDLPSRFDQVQWIELPPKILSKYRKAEGNYLRHVREQLMAEMGVSEKDFHSLTKQEQGEILRTLIKKNRAYHLTRISELRVIVAEGKAKNLPAWVASNFRNEPVLVFCIHRQLSLAMATNLNTPTPIIGGVSRNVAHVSAQSFQRGDHDVLVGSVASMGEGLNLTRAKHVVLGEVPWTPGEVDQAVDRAHRRGQSSNVVAWHILAPDTIDEAMHRRLQMRRGLLSQLHDGVELGSLPADDDVVDVVDIIIGGLLKKT